MRTFVAAADAGQFSDAAADLSITQQAVSKRIAVDASFRAVTAPARQLLDGLEAARVLDEPVQLLTGAGP